MAQITVSNPAVIEKLQNDAAFRQKFLANTKASLDHIGVPIDQQTLDKILGHQLSGLKGTSAASTVAIITVF